MTSPGQTVEIVLAEPGEFPDEELLLRLYLAESVVLRGDRVVFTDEPQNPLVPPVGLAMRLPGQGVRASRPWEATRRVQTGTMGQTRADSRAMNQQVENLMLALDPRNGGTGYRGVMIDRVTQNNGPAQVPYSPDVRYMPAAWDLTFRRHAAIAAPIVVRVGADGRPVDTP